MQNLSKVLIFGATSPAPVEVVKKYGMKQRTINFDIKEEKNNEYNYRWQSVTLDLSVWGYDEIVSAIVKNLYSSDRMESVINNYLTIEDVVDAEKAEEYRQEMAEMQEWRVKAKQMAKDLLKYAEDNNL